MTETVRRFYESAPFPGYPAPESLHSLRARAERNGFARLLDRAIAGNARIADVGCGSGQMCLYLASADRFVVGADLTRASPALGAAAAVRFGLERVSLSRPTSISPASSAAPSTSSTRRGSCTTPATCARRSASWSSWHARRCHCARCLQRDRAHSHATEACGGTSVRLSSRALRSDASGSLARFPAPRGVAARSVPASRGASSHHREVQRWFAERGVEYLRTYPSAVFDDTPEDLLTRAADNWGIESWLTQIAWMRTLGREGGLFFTIGRKKEAPEPAHSA